MTITYADKTLTTSISAATKYCNVPSNTGVFSNFSSGGWTWGPRIRTPPTCTCVPPRSTRLGAFRLREMPDCWGIFLSADGDARSVSAIKGDNLADVSTTRQPAVTQGDRNPPRSSSSATGLTCPSLYDLRNLFQVNVEEGRHLWAMVYPLHRYCRDGREEAEALLQRRSGDRDNPRILGAFNERTSDWLAFFMFYLLQTGTESSSSWP